MKYVLIYYLFSGAIPTTGTALFDDRAACEAAIDALGKASPGNSVMRREDVGVCVAQASAPAVEVTPEPAPAPAGRVQIPGRPR